MNPILRKIRHYYWILTAFIRKNAKFLFLSFIAGFFVIILLLKISPLINSVIFTKKEVIGVLGQYSPRTIPNDIAQDISNPLIVIDQKGEIKPVLAESWEILNDGKTYRFYLKKNLYWNDKKKFTTKDISYKLQDVTVKAVNEHTLDFNLKQPLSIFPMYLTKPVMKYPLIGVGSSYSAQSYKVKRNILESIHLTPNTEGLPVKIYRFYQTEDDLITAYKKGNITMFKTQNRNIADMFSSWRNSDIITENDFNQLMTLFINTKSSILQERDVRKALAYATPSFNEYGIKANGPIPPTSWAHHADLKEYIKNDERAKTLLEKNIEASDSAKLTLYTFFEYADIADALQDSYEAIGFDIDLKIVSYVPQDFDLLLTIWNPPMDPDQYFFWHSTQEATNLTKLNNVKVDKLLEEGRSTRNIKQRINIYHDFQKTIIEEVPAHFLFYPKIYTIRRK